MQTYKTIIIGGGMAGLGCARTLIEHGKTDFLLLTKDIGGRVTTSEDHAVNYGAFYARDDYTYVLPYIRLRKRIKLRDIAAGMGHKQWSYRAVIRSHPVALIRLYCEIIRFNRHYQWFKKNSVVMSQKEALECDPYLQKLYTQDAKEFLKEKNLHVLLASLINPVIWTTAFLHAENVSAIVMLGCLLILVHRTYEFSPDWEKLIAPFSKNIIQDAVLGIAYTNDHWTIETEKGDVYRAQAIVLATPINVTKRLLHLKEKTNTPISVFMAHVRGKLRATYETLPYHYIIFSPSRTDVALVKEPNNTYIFYSHKKQYDLSHYFSEYTIIHQRHWDPAFFMGNIMIESARKNNVYVIGDHNVCSMEDAFTTGVYAANQIIKSS